MRKLTTTFPAEWEDKNQKRDRHDNFQIRAGVYAVSRSRPLHDANVRIGGAELSSANAAERVPQHLIALKRLNPVRPEGREYRRAFKGSAIVRTVE